MNNSNSYSHLPLEAESLMAVGSGGPVAPAIQTYGPPRPTPEVSGAWTQLPPSLQLKPVQRKVSGGLMKIMSDF